MMGRTILGATATTFIIALVACGGAAQSTVTQPTSVTYIANLSGANEFPAVTTSATGTAVYTLSGNTLTYTVTVNGNMTASATSSHIHAAPAGANGNVIVPFVTANVGSGVVTSGSIDLSQPISNGTTSISGDSLRTLLNNGGAYTNVHSSQFKAGEIRGQIVRQ
jgi:hypothetical protein